MKEKIEKFIRLYAEWLTEIEQAAKTWANRHHKFATALCVIVGFGAIALSGSLIGATVEMFIVWIVTTLRLICRGVMLAVLAIVMRFAYRVARHIWENKPESKQPFK